ncbi:MAG: DUF3047 domain-containing protein [Rhodospirillales bacterium]|nr:DUF3047 domain-containing protein [Rhodospirillales bacterium]
MLVPLQPWLRRLLARGRFFAFAWALMLIGCAEETAMVEPDGKLDVLGPAPGFSTQSLPSGWVIAGGAAQARFSVIEYEGIPVLKVTSGDQEVYAVRRVDASLLTTPYLSWSWNVDAHGQGQHPVRLIVGFRGGQTKSGASRSRWSGPSLPAHDRILALTWGDSALNRGTLAASDDGRAWPTYTVRGGRENSRNWWLETVDLAQLYAGAWPEDDPSTARLMFIGVAVVASPKTAVAHVAGVQLSR